MNARNFFTELKRPGKRLQVRGFFCALRGNTPLFEVGRVLVRLDHIASFIVNANHSIMRAAEKLCVSGLEAAI